jgi:type I restriction enzyme S subunit
LGVPPPSLPNRAQFASAGPFFSRANIATHGKVDLSEVYYIPPDYKDGTDAYALEPGHVLFNNTNSVELVGKTALVTEPMQCVFSNHIYRLTVKAKAHLDSAWLALALRALWNRGYFEEYCNRWIGQAGFNQKMLKAVEIPIPHPEDPARSLATQRRIVARIEGLFAELGAARHLHAALVHDAEQLMDAALWAIFEKQDTWQTYKMGELVTIEASQVDPTLPEYRDLPHINGSTIESVTGQLGDYQTAAEDGMTSAKYHFHPGAVLYSKIRPYLRKAATVDFEGVCSADMYPLRVQTDNLSRDFLKWTLLSHPFTEYASELSGRARMPKLNRKQLFAYPIRVPDLTAQRHIVGHLDEVQTQAAELQHAAAAVAADLDRLEQSILAQAFKGKL